MLARSATSKNFVKRCFKIGPVFCEQSSLHLWIAPNLNTTNLQKATVLAPVMSDLHSKTAASIIKRNFCSTNGISVAEYKEIKDLPNHPEKLLIDVREPDELAKYGIIPTSINIPLDTLEETFTSKLAKENFNKKFHRNFPDVNSEIIFSCMRGIRAQKAAEIAKRVGFKNVKNYKGSWMDWAEHEGIPIPS